MSQTNWAYCNKRGQLYKIGLYHGDESGHVLIYCNNQILTIDFEVDITKSYTFYLDQDICEVSITKELPGAYIYDLRVNDEKASDLPLAKNNNQDYSYILYAGLAGLLLFSIIFSLSNMFIQSLG